MQRFKVNYKVGNIRVEKQRQCGNIQLGQMLVISERINCLIKTIVFHTTKSRRTFTPKPFNDPRLTPLGIFTKPPRSYDYQLPQSLPNRHLYWDRKVQNKQLRNRYNKARLQRLGINPIHDSQGKPLLNRDINQLISQLSNLNLIKQSLGRTMTNLHEAIVRFPDQFLANGPESDVLNYAFKEIHDRYLPSMSFYRFCTYCQLRFRAKLPPTQALMLHLYKFMETSKQNTNQKLTIERLGQLSSYIFSRQYPNCVNLIHKPKITFELFTEGTATYITFEDILTNMYSQQYLKSIKSKLEDKKIRASLKAIMKIPGGHKLVQIINAA